MDNNIPDPFTYTIAFNDVPYSHGLQKMPKKLRAKRSRHTTGIKNSCGHWNG